MKKVGLSLLLVLITQDFYSQSKIFISSFNEVTLSTGMDVSLVQGEDEFISLGGNLTRNDILFEIQNGKLNIQIKKQNALASRMNNAKLVLHYKTLDHISVLGNDNVSFESPHQGTSLCIKLLENSNLRMNKVELEMLQVLAYGDSFLLIEDGYSENTNYRCYSQGKINTVDMESKLMKLISFGANFIRVNASDLLDITSYGDTRIDYLGDLKVKKGIIDGRLKVNKISRE